MNKYMLAAVAVLGGASVAQAATFEFTSILNSGQSTTGSTSSATGVAKISVDDVAESIDFNLAVSGIDLDDLWDTLVAAPVGPVHFHDGVAGSTGPVAIPFAFGATYSDTTDGFNIDVADLSYADAVAVSGFGESFDDFLTGLGNSEYYINFHTDTYNGGEIRGQISAVPLPASALLLVAGLGGLAGLRRKSI